MHLSSCLLKEDAAATVCQRETFFRLQLITTFAKCIVIISTLFAFYLNSGSMESNQLKVQLHLTILDCVPRIKDKV